MRDALISRARSTTWRVWAAPGPAARPVGQAVGPCASRARPNTDATSIGVRPIPRPKHTSPRPEADDLRASPIRERVLVTGALGCVGAWTLKAALDAGDDAFGFDLGDRTQRLDLVLTPAEQERITLIQGDITDLDGLGRVLDEHGITRVVHLAALQVPFCRADPALGARVNVVGTVNLFEAVKQRLNRIPGVAYASSAAVYGPDDSSPAPESGGAAPATFYGVTKQTNEETARLYWAESHVPSFGIRPYVVYGPGRDQGMTSAPTLAMEAAARGEGCEIAYGGDAQYDYAPTVGVAFHRAASVREGAVVANFPGVPASMAEVVAAIEAAAPEVEGRISWIESPLPFPAELEATALERALGPLRAPALADGVHETIERFRRS
ncbi:MAG: GDP-mannose 4,6-dehydratase [Gaiellaceae bacterium MAG52_C11]|nr:GDP-mannose 4,6-dehydratase [Candidatus Gaiellasilicea maunaloa]